MTAPSRRLLLVHAHPDDESLATGITIAQAVRTGAQVTLVTCTRGERGEVIGPNQHLAHPERLGPVREQELSAAMRALGVRDHRLLAQGRWQDSGMRWLAPGKAGPAPDTGARAFARADLDEAAQALAEVLREVRPHSVITYDPRGGYDHPDHVQAHRVTMRAVQLVDWPMAVHWVQVARSWQQADRRAISQAVHLGELPEALRPPEPGDPALVLPDAEIDVLIEATAEDRAAATAALAAHATQVQLYPPWFALSDGVAARLRQVEGFKRVTGPPISGARPVTDLFHGIHTE